MLIKSLSTGGVKRRVEEQQQTSQKADLLDIGADIMESERFRKAHAIPHHFDFDVAAHSMDAAKCAMDICHWLNRHGISVNVEDVVRASLLHDIGMTEDDVFQSLPSEKAYTHPVEGARIAHDEYGANEAQLDAILFHMWPIGFVPPHHLPGWILVAADKLSSIQETGDYAARSIKRFVPGLVPRFVPRKRVDNE